MKRKTLKTSFQALVILGLLMALALRSSQATPDQADAGASSPQSVKAVSRAVVYSLDFEHPAQRTMPAAPPAGWAREYAPIIHSNEEPAVRAAHGPDEPVRSGHWSARFQLDKTDPILNNGTRAEIAGTFEPVGAERWVGFSVYLPKTWVPDRSAEIVCQFHQHWTVGSSPPLAFQTHNGSFEISQNFEGYQVDTPIGKYETGKWTDWVVHVKWSAGRDGLLDIWKNGVPVPGFFHKPGKNTYNDPLHGVYLKEGIYKWAWSQGKFSDTTRRVLYMDETRITDGTGSYAAVAPR